MSPIIVALIALAAVAVLAGVAYVVMGKGGELARFEADHPPLELPSGRPLSGPDVSRVLLPLALWGYHVRAVDDVLRRVVGALSERDARIADLERRLAEAGRPVPPDSAPGSGAGAAGGDTGPTAAFRAGSHPGAGTGADLRESGRSGPNAGAAGPSRSPADSSDSAGAFSGADGSAEAGSASGGGRESAAAAPQRPRAS
ncbi:hypothetical protein [Streptomonospora salina]|uniref:Cell division protein DivIVA n=1 Tax=Streptomonospora salina TaxID=104205 RepID=A0A841EDR3_9ACTN|nr:hypothetical protein [Streptomonospora salina]MBB5999479.1 hypothetical protein [Streptomonospora salina]